MTTSEHFDANHIHTTPEGRHFRHGDGVEVDGEGNPIAETFTATFRLMQADGVQGPKHECQVESEQHAKELAAVWSEGQIGHPWDVCTIEIPELDVCVELSGAQS